MADNKEDLSVALLTDIDETKGEDIDTKARSKITNILSERWSKIKELNPEIISEFVDNWWEKEKPKQNKIEAFMQNFGSAVMDVTDSAVNFIKKQGGKIAELIDKVERPRVIDVSGEDYRKLYKPKKKSLWEGLFATPLRTLVVEAKQKKAGQTND